MTRNPSPAAGGRGHLPGASTPLAVVITTSLASSHSTGQYLALLAALALALTHDVLIHPWPARHP